MDWDDMEREAAADDKRKTRDGVEDDRPQKKKRRR